MTDGASGPTGDGSATSSDSPLPPTLEFLYDAVDDARAAGFVAVGGDVADLRYLTGRAADDERAVDGERAVVVTDDDAALSVPAPTGVAALDPCEPIGVAEAATAADVDGAASDFPGSVRRRAPGAPAGQHAATLLDELLGEGAGEGTVLVPRDLPHDAAVYLERAGYDLASTRVVADARATKSRAERERLRRAQGVAARGIARAASLLDDRDPESPDAIDPGTLRRDVTGELAGAGAVDVSRTTVAPRDGRLDPARPVVLALAPRLADGSYGRLVRTLVADGEGGWERRAHVAVGAALRVAADELEPGVDADAVRREAVAELGSFGFEPADPGDSGAGSASSGSTGCAVDVHGVGLAPRETPDAERDESVPAGSVVAVDVVVRDADEGTVRLADLFFVGDEGEVDGTTTLGDVPRSLSPDAYLGDADQGR